MAGLTHVLAAAFLSASLWADGSGTIGLPVYTEASIANSAANVTNFFAPDTFVTVYGSNLSYVTKALTAGEIRQGTLPTILQGTGVRVLVNNTQAIIFFVSPTQVNFLIPTSIRPGKVTFQVLNETAAGPAVPVTLGTAAPALFQMDETNVIATHGNGPVVTKDSPAQRGEVVVIYATGLGTTSPPAIPYQVAKLPATLEHLSEFQVLLNDTPVDARAIWYAGVTPGYTGLFQINLRLPDDAPANPEIRVGYSGLMSPPGRILPLE